MIIFKEYLENVMPNFKLMSCSKCYIYSLKILGCENIPCGIFSKNYFCYSARALFCAGS